MNTKPEPLRRPSPLPGVAVVGACNLDIGGRPHRAAVMADSNPGEVRTSPGGVGRNIAENLALLGARVQLLTVFGDDPNAAALRESCEAAGIDIGHAQVLPDTAGAVYLFITDEGGEMRLAVSDMAVYERMTPDFLAARMDVVNTAALCVADTNLPAETLAYLAAHCRVPLFIDPVSTAKAAKLVGLLPHIHTLKPNRLEAELLSGVAIVDDASLAQAAEALLRQGLSQVFITLGPKGVYAASTREAVRLPALAGPVVNTTGAGDTFTAALAFGFLRGFSLAETAQAGLAAAGICIASAGTVGRVSAEAVLAGMAGFAGIDLARRF